MKFGVLFGCLGGTHRFLKIQKLGGAFSLSEERGGEAVVPCTRLHSAHHSRTVSEERGKETNVHTYLTSL